MDYVISYENCQEEGPASNVSEKNNYTNDNGIDNSQSDLGYENHTDILDTRTFW